MAAVFFLQCHNKECTKSIWLPPIKHLDTTCDHDSWPSDGLPRNFVCRACGVIASYARSESRCHVRPRPKLIEELRPLSLICTEMTCGQEGCESPFLILSLGSKLLATTMSSLPGATAIDALCERGHAQNGLILPDSRFFARPVFDWNL